MGRCEAGLQGSAEDFSLDEGFAVRDEARFPSGLDFHSQAVGWRELFVEALQELGGMLLPELKFHLFLGREIHGGPPLVRAAAESNFRLVLLSGLA